MIPGDQVTIMVKFFENFNWNQNCCTAQSFTSNCKLFFSCEANGFKITASWIRREEKCEFVLKLFSFKPFKESSTTSKTFVLPFFYVWCLPIMYLQLQKEKRKEKIILHFRQRAIKSKISQNESPMLFVHSLYLTNIPWSWSNFLHFILEYHFSHNPLLSTNNKIKTLHEHPQH